jgi:hypothetical protein
MKNTIVWLLLTAVCFFPLRAAADALNACSVITHGEAEKAAGVNLAAGRLTEYEARFMQGITLCHFESLDGKHYTRFVSIELAVSDTRQEAREKFNAGISMIDSPESVRDIGEEAAWSGNLSSPRGGLNVLAGRFYLVIKVNTENERKDHRQARELAGKILDRLPLREPTAE